MKNIYRSLHKWMALPFGLIMSVICITGAILVWEGYVTEKKETTTYKVERDNRSVIPLSALLPKVAKTLPDSVKITGVTISSNPTKPYKVSLSKPRRASVYVNQYTGEVIGSGNRLPFFVTVMKLHRWLLDTVKGGGSMSVGKFLVGISTIMFIFVIITGWLMIFKRKVSVKKLLRIRFTSGFGKFFHDLHIAGGIYATIFLLIMALTGLTWSFGWYNNALYYLFGAEPPKAHQQVVAQNEKTSGRENSKREGKPFDKRKGERNGEHKENKFDAWQKALTYLQNDCPNSEQITIKNGEASVKLENTLSFATDKYTFDNISGNIVSTVKYEDSEKASKIRGWIYALHTGTWAGNFSRILWFLAVLIGFSLPISGYYLWFKHFYNLDGLFGWIKTLMAK